MLNFLLEEKILAVDKKTADIGSGTGIFTEQLLTKGFDVFAVEPNTAMRLAAETKLGKFEKFYSVNGTAEQTTLADLSIDIITVATAFHWFDQNACYQEFKRILSNDNGHGHVLLFWNLRLPELSPILQGYDELLKKHCSEYKGLPSHQMAQDEIIRFFEKDSASVHEFENSQYFDLEGFIGRLRSTSYSLTPDHPGYESMIEEQTELFYQYQQGGKIKFPYLTRLYLGKV